MATTFERRVLVQSSPALARYATQVDQLNLPYPDPERQELAAQVLLQELQESGALRPEQLGVAHLTCSDRPILCVETGDEDSWLEIHAATGRVELVYWPDVVESEGGEP